VLGEFFYQDSVQESKLGQRETRKATILENGAKYEGEWIVGSECRQGRGT